MLAVKGRYRNGVIDLLEPIPNSPPDKAAYDEAIEDYKKGEFIDLEEYLKQRGLQV